jgi:molecular chaperone GrpE
MKRSKHQETPENTNPAVKKATGQADNQSVQTSAEQVSDQSLDQTREEMVATDITAEKLVKCEADMKELADRFLRLMAEYDNFRRRTQKEREALYSDSIAVVVKEWLPVIDNLDRAEQAALAAEGENVKSIAEGVLLVLKQAEDAMTRLNVREIDCLGKPFDPNLAEAVLHIEDDSVGPSTVVQILQKGYVRDDRVIRHCIVKVAN